jgi:hypothetical protein
MAATPRVVLATLAAGLLAAPAAAHAQAPVVGAFPTPGTISASPETQISLRGRPADQLGPITVTGSKSGPHTGHVEAHSDGQGGSFVVDQPFTGGETVRVATDLPIPGARDGDYSFKTVARPTSGLQSDPKATDPSLLQALTGQVGSVPKGGDPTFQSRRDLRPPKITVTTRAAGRAPGLIFLAPKKVFGAKRPDVQSGPMIMDDTGSPVWFAPNDKGNVTDLRVQQYGGRPVLTYWAGRAVLGTGEGVVQMLDSSYRPLKTIRAGNGYSFDLHESTITPDGKLLGIIYNPVKRSLAPYGGSKDGRVIDAVIQEVDIATGLVTFEWHSLGTIGLDEGRGEVPKNATGLYDYVHPNAATLTPDGNILVSGREVWAAYELNKATGALMARIGGEKSDYRFVGAARPAWQHDWQWRTPDTMTIFDNEAAPKVRDQSRALTLRIDTKAKTLTEVKAFDHDHPLVTGTQGNNQVLPNGNHFVEWGSQGYLSEFTPGGKQVFDARIARGQDSYRGYRFGWVGTPATLPDVAAQDGGRTVYASWNGATQVASWTVLAGATADALAPVASAPRSGFETRVRTPRDAAFVAVQAKDAAGTALATSKPVRSTK